MIMSKYCRALKKTVHYIGNESGAIAILFALSLPMFIGAAGIAVDLAQAYNVKNRLGNALDKAALAAASTTGTAEDVEAQAKKYFDANFPDAKLGTPYDFAATVSDGFVTVSASARVDTTFMSILGQDYMNVYSETQVVRDLAGVEIVLVLDVTGSMAGNNITALKTSLCAASGTTCTENSFMNIMFTKISDVEYLRIGIVPFSQSVNVGPYGLGVDLTGAPYETAFVDRPATDDHVSPSSDIQYTTTSTSLDWYGCILERASPGDTTDETTPNWGMYRYPKTCTKYKNGKCVSYSNPNNGCTGSIVVPLTNDQPTLVSSIANLKTAGNTYGNVGMVWGWHLISPDFPFTEGVAYDDPDWSKTVIMMTDGDNTIASKYSVYGDTAAAGLTADDLDAKFAETCENMKAKGITLYTITFQSGISDATREIFRACASDASKYYNAPSNDDLVAAFEEIAHQLSQLHIIK